MAVMNRKDAENIIKDLSEKPFICSEDTIETVSGYIILQKEKNPNLRKSKQTNADRIRSMSDKEMATDLVNIFEELFEDGVPSPEYMLMWLQSEVEE